MNYIVGILILIALIYFVIEMVDVSVKEDK